MTDPYFDDGTVRLYLGDYREIVPLLGPVDLAVTDPPYGETSLEWDRWQSGWPEVVAASADSMWCFGSMRMFLDNAAEFSCWKLSQDIVWEKHNGSCFHADRFRRVHEHALHWYRGSWSNTHHQPQYTMDATARTVRSKRRPAHTGDIERTPYQSEDGGPRLMTSVLKVRSMHGNAIHPTEKPIGVLTPLIEYGCPSGGTVLDCFAGSGSTLDAARLSGRKAIGVEINERYAEAAANRLAQGVLL